VGWITGYEVIALIDPWTRRLRIELTVNRL